MEDSDPDVRVASIWALVDYGDTRSLNQGISGLRDPVDRVRIATAKALGKHGTESTFKELKKVLADKNEIKLVKSAVVYGLGESDDIRALDILVDTLPDEKELSDEITDALSKKTGKKELLALVEHLKDASPDLRDQLIWVFTKIGRKGRLAAAELLEEDIPSLKPVINEILEKTGAVESAIRNLSNRNPEIRCSAAEFLSKVGTVQAFRGIVLAARDPNQDVRVRVVKALERLNTPSGRGTLTELREDPDKRVRKYTEWAMERIKSKSL
jgi:HEAT repeat protein